MSYPKHLQDRGEAITAAKNAAAVLNAKSEQLREAIDDLDERLRSACQTRSGVSGSAVRRTPIAWAMALAIAGAVGIKPLSPMPFDPCGPGPSAFSTRMLRKSAGRSSIVGMR